MENSEAKIMSSLGAAKLSEMSVNPAVYTDFLKFQGRIFKQPAPVALEFFAQRPDVTFIANAKQWVAAGYRIIDGSEAIHFTDENGKVNDLFDFSQVEGNLAPRLWTINAENANEFKSALGAEQDAPIIKSVMEQTVKKSSVIECMEALEISPQEFETFAKSYFNAVQTIVAGRFEIGGNKFALNPDMTAFTALDYTRKMHFLIMVSNAARASLLKVEKIANEINTKNLQERNELNEEINVSRVGKSHTGTAEQHAGERITADSEGEIGERSADVENDYSERTESLGDIGRGTGQPENLSGIQAEGRVGTDDLVQIQPDVGVLHHEFDGHGNIDGGRTDWALRDEVDGVYAGAVPALSGGDAAQSDISDSSKVGGRNGVGVSGASRQPVHESQSPPEDIRGNSELGENESVLHGRSGDEGESADTADSRITKLNSVLNETSVNKTDVFNLETPVTKEQKAIECVLYTQFIMFINVSATR